MVEGPRSRFHQKVEYNLERGKIYVRNLIEIEMVNRVNYLDGFYKNRKTKLYQGYG